MILFLTNNSLKIMKLSIKALFSSKKNMSMKGSGKIMKGMVVELSNGKEVQFMKAIGKIT